MGVMWLNVQLCLYEIFTQSLISIGRRVYRSRVKQVCGQVYQQVPLFYIHIFCGNQEFYNVLSLVLQLQQT